MYVPQAFAAPSHEVMLEVIRRYALGIVMVGDDGGVEVAQVPCLRGRPGVHVPSEQDQLVLPPNIRTKRE